MQKIKAFANYGMLAHEKEPVFTLHRLVSEISDEIEIEIPDEFKISQNYSGEYLIDIPGKHTYLLRDVISTYKKECVLEWRDSRFIRRKKLNWSVL